MVRLFRVSIPTSLIALLVSEIAVLFSCYALATLFLHEDPEFFLLYNNGLLKIGLVVLVLLLLLYFNDLYSDYRVRSKTGLLQQVCLVVGGAFLAQATLKRLFRASPIQCHSAGRLWSPKTVLAKQKPNPAVHTDAAR